MGSRMKHRIEIRVKSKMKHRIKPRMKSKMKHRIKPRMRSRIEIRIKPRTNYMQNRTKIQIRTRINSPSIQMKHLYMR